MTYRKLVVLIFACLFFTACDDDFISTRDYPVFFTDPASEITNEGVTLSVTLLNEGTSPVLSHGFQWGEAGGIYNFKVELTDTDLSDFSVRIDSDLKEGVMYKYRSFARTENYVIEGEELYFESKGSNEAVFTDFNPKSGEIGDVITISGNYFSLDKNRIGVILGGQNIDIEEVGRDFIKFKVPRFPIVNGATSISMFSGTSMMSHPASFEILGHKITGVTPNPIKIGDQELIIQGTRFSETPSTNRVNLGSTSLQVISASKTELRVRIPQHISVGNYDLSVKINFLTEVFNEKVTVVP